MRTEFLCISVVYSTDRSIEAEGEGWDHVSEAVLLL